MSAVEEIQAAIDKLTKQREQSAPGPWWAWHPENGRGNSSVDAATHDPDNPDMAVEGDRVNVDLIVTLHRTIDAQLAILAEYLDDVEVDAELLIASHCPVFALARAINGGTT